MKQRKSTNDVYGKRGASYKARYQKKNDELANRMRRSSIKRITEKVRYDFRLGET